MACVLKREKAEAKNMTMLIRVSSDAYNAVSKLARESNQNISKVACQLILYASQECKVED